MCMAMSSQELTGLQASEMPCPNPACERTFACDACLHAHLVRRYGKRYGEVFGRVDEAFLHFCPGHQGVSPTLLGLY